MQRGIIYGQEVCMQGSPYTLLVYKHAFGGDLMRDLMSAYETDQSSDHDEDDIEISSTPVPEISTFLQIAWAMARTYSDDTPDYPNWLRSFDAKEFSLGDSLSLGVIDSAIAAELFCRRETGRIRQWCSRRLERLAKFARNAADRIRA